MLKLNLEGIYNFLDWRKHTQTYAPQIKSIHQKLHQDKQLKEKYLGWLELPLHFDFKEIEKMKQLKNFHPNLDVLVVIGIGGSYLGAKAGIEFLQTPFKKTKPEILFAGHQVSGNYLTNLLHFLKNKNWAINVISKSGTTLEPALAFRILKKEIEEKYGKQLAKNRIFVTTDSQKGVLLNLALKEGYQTFVIPDSVGGRFSVFTSVGILPFVFANLDVASMMKGALQSYHDTFQEDLLQNQAYKYALARYLFHTQQNKKMEILVSYEPNLLSFSEWWKQLFAESEGKEEKGLFVGATNNSTDLHSLGQFIQEGTKMLFETVLNVSSIKDDCVVPHILNELDNLNYVAGKTYSQINQKILQATRQAHIEGKVPNLEIVIPTLDAYHFGYLAYFFQKACAMSGLLLGINPFNQHGVEIYKQKMFALLKP
ncbi:glucose-6-phosphate isomerase [Aster yellows witches'-broom phytoplasma AYWB]|uniref:Glucose-6-phosphate isomerase n=2 Tax=16SrI (Aster yellows group) TaxID=3042590 RepID=G6PI_AYWBP|nr:MULTISPECIES: glucose-6-phosphate isomerase [16SrI (Aster yellows group)]Q2NJ38.1 RecName: Full=Glucose-6-phosphate isomerase; Short=GPI; AltName: Full=Phosphoglucose isomerase; Short=PGI; AltName: Full=Phosphohexose isomerase; Short=PHI [Aster yellows witches'-broom phytoplasma AYWB]ABC65555.1 glucose-6-phosphate isomerase [Aster yellows witches'-broom phytoplasma AYWB]PEH36238.1 glucose-6-phosphate isomerase [New Jersey aster yellows phytoplasma]